MRSFNVPLLAVVSLALAVSGCSYCGFVPGAAPTEEATLQGPSLGDTWTRPADGMVMVYVPPGEFQMGSTEAEVDAALELCEDYLGSSCQRAWFEIELPAHTVALDSFWIDRTEVTNAQYARCVAAGACDPPVSSSSYTRGWYYGGHRGYDDYPVILVSWWQVEAYCAWAGGRLPTEAEWEYAARGPEGRRYPWGDAFDGSRLNNRSDADGYDDTAPVGSYPSGASWCGALDLAGNVYEWVADWYGTYPSGRQVNPTGPPGGEDRVLRGGSWANEANFVRCATRNGWYPDGTDSSVGFRCARSSE